MLEDFFVVPAAAQRLRSSLFGEHLDEFWHTAAMQLLQRGVDRSVIAL